MNELANIPIEPPRGPDASALDPTAVAQWLERLGNEWVLNEQGHLHKAYKFADFASALEFVNEVGRLSDEVDHHPFIGLTWGRAEITIWTHSVGGLSEADFVFCAHCDRIFTG